ncbi:hypothetical protein [Leifsonia sp. Leaf264]|uniref:hypothetical protein n=1 Tax=Leifsonia sp. Leaf264 TaxID=1736314 RepID=UPI0006F246DD|nr:hypothetical protein [Leifsonia sp. Leaf264]KQO98387.1 hypothetical protein ASF30_10020 [Leifsonia sp. Leaf264]
MSYDVTLVAENSEGLFEDLYWRNHTRNTSQMWRDAGCDIAEFHGKTAAEFAAALAPAIADIEARPEHHEQYVPDNKWGTVKTTLLFLHDLLDACNAHPDATVEVDR